MFSWWPVWSSTALIHYAVYNLKPEANINPSINKFQTRIERKSRTLCKVLDLTVTEVDGVGSACTLQKSVKYLSSVQLQFKSNETLKKHFECKASEGGSEGGQQF